MKRALVLLVALAAPASASAKPAPVPACSCESTRVLPAPSAVDVPTNARFWRLPSRTPGPRIKPYELAPHAAFVLRGVSFTTGSGPDDEPPIPPSVAAASVALSGTRVARLHITAATSADTAVVHLRFSDALGAVNYYTTPDQLSVCSPDLEIMAGHLRLAVTAIDLAGNESAADITELDTTSEPVPPSCAAAVSSEDRAHIGLAFLLALGGIGLYLSRANLRRRDRERTALTAFALPAVEEVVRATRLRSLATIAVVGIATSLALHDHALAAYAIAVTPLGAVLVIDALLRHVTAGRVRALLRYDGATADVQHDTVGVVVGKQRAMVRAAPRIVERARHHALPKATL